MDYIAAMCMSHTGDPMMNTLHTASDSLNHNHGIRAVCCVE